MPIRIKVTLIILAVFALLAVVGPLVVPVPALENTVAPRQLADPNSLFVEVNNLTVHYKTVQHEAGQGEPHFVLLHGFGASVFSWREVMTPLAQLGTVVAFDRPAFGLTERPLRDRWNSVMNGANPYSPDAQVALTLGLMDTLGIERAVLVGNSSGGTVAAQFALEHPDRVAGLVLVSAAVYQGGGTPGWVRPLLNTPQMNRLGPLISRELGGSAGLNVLRSSWSDPAGLTDEVIAGYRKPLQADNWDIALWELTRASRTPQFAARLGDITAPTLVVTGDGDQIVPRALNERLATDIPGAELVVLESCGHLPQEECPASFMSAVETFAERLPVTALR